MRWLALAALVTACATAAPPTTTPSRFIAEGGGDRLVVFVHGIAGDSESTWRNRETGAYWPELLATDPAMAGFDVYVIGFASPFLSRASTIEEIAQRLLQQFRDRGFFSRYSQIHFVTHSMGGLVIKRFLTELNRAAEAETLRRVRTVVLISTPSLGAPIAELAALLSLNPQTRDIAPADLTRSCRGSRTSGRRSCATATPPASSSRSRARARKVGGYQPRSFDCGVGSHSHHRHVSRGPPCDPGRRDFPGPVLTWAVPREPSRRRRGLSAGARIPPPGPRFARGLAPAREETVVNGSESDRTSPCPAPPSAQGPFARRRRYRRRRDVPHRVGEHYPSVLAQRTHAPDHRPPTASGCPLVGGSSQVVAPCWTMALPDFIPAPLA